LLYLIKMFNKKDLPKYGVGLGLRRSLRQETLDFIKNNPKQDLINWLEIVPENHIAKGGLPAKQLEDFADLGIQLIPHGVNLSIGTATKANGEVDYDPILINELKKLFSKIKAPWFSDHLSCTRIQGLYLQNLIPIPRTLEAVKIISDNIKFLEDSLQLPFLIENPSFYSDIHQAELNEIDFINAILQEADCGMLLDVNNILVNSINHGHYQPLDFLNALDLSRVVQVHIAGHDEDYQGFLAKKKLKVLDTHGSAIKKEVFDILVELLKRTEVNAILLERDSNFPDFNEILEELTELKKINSGVCL